MPFLHQQKGHSLSLNYGMISKEPDNSRSVTLLTLPKE